MYKDKIYGIVFINVGHVILARCYKRRAHGVARCYKGRAHGVARCYKGRAHGVARCYKGRAHGVARCYKGRAHGVARCYKGRAHGVGRGQMQTRGDPVRAGCRSACNGQMARLAPQFGQQVSSAGVGDARECETGPAVLLADGSD